MAPIPITVECGYGSRGIDMKTLLLITLITAFFIGGCTERRPKPLPEITSELEEGYYDLVFAIIDHKKLADGTQSIHVSGTHEGRTVSLEILLGSDWKPSPLSDDLPLTMHRGGVVYRSIGAESDQLLQSLDQIYKTKQSPKAMNKETTFTGISLEGNPQNLAQGPVKIKLFFESDAEDQYAELFTNIDLKSQKLYIREKDEEYRASIIRALKSS